MTKTNDGGPAFPRPLVSNESCGLAHPRGAGMSEVMCVVSLSGGKDSQATAILALDAFPKERVRLVFADTGNEHALTYEHLDYLEQQFCVPISRRRADFTREIAQKRHFVSTKWPEQGVSAEIVARALEFLHPTGNPFLDLCIWKGRFPSRRAQFCTQELKRRLLDAYMIERMAEGWRVESWQGVRRDESTWRTNALERELTPEGWEIVRPVVDWTAQQVVDFCLSRGTALNPLYTLGMKRVGCMPCINACKDEILAISQRFPDVPTRIEEWETIVAAASKHGVSTFFTAPDDGRGDLRGRGIREVIEWSKTSHGGRQYDLERIGPAELCSSSYGLCE